MKLFWVLAVAAVMSGCMYVSGSAEGESTMHVAAIDVGQGLAVLLEYDGRYAMYDFGPDSVGVVDSLLKRGVDTLEWVVLSHNHRDHIGGFLELAGRGVFVRQLYVGPDTAGAFFRDSVLRVARALGTPIDTLLRGGNVSFWGGGNGSAGGECPRFEVLWPASYLRVGENRASVVLLGKFGASKMLLTGESDTFGGAFAGGASRFGGEQYAKLLVAGVAQVRVRECRKGESLRASRFICCAQIELGAWRFYETLPHRFARLRPLRTLAEHGRFTLEITGFFYYRFALVSE